MNEFIEYMHDFYGIKGLYPMQITDHEILIATGIRLERYQNIPFHGDTLDREKVRDIVVEMRQKYE